jgi:hypothetical protein
MQGGTGGGGFVCERVIIITWGEIMRDGGANQAMPAL